MKKQKHNQKLVEYFKIAIKLKIAEYSDLSEQSRNKIEYIYFKSKSVQSILNVIEESLPDDKLKELADFIIEHVIEQSPNFIKQINNEIRLNKIDSLDIISK